MFAGDSGVLARMLSSLAPCTSHDRMHCIQADISPAVRKRRETEASAYAPSHFVPPDMHKTHTKQCTDRPKQRKHIMKGKIDK